MMCDGVIQTDITVFVYIEFTKLIIQILLISCGCERVLRYRVMQYVIGE